MSEIVDIAQRFRRDLLRGESRAANQLITQYGVVWERLRSDIRAITNQIQKARDAGVEVNEAWLFQNVRLEALEAQIVGQVEQYTTNADTATTASQREAATIADDLHRASLQAASVQPSLMRLPDEAITNIVGLLQNGSPLATVLDGYGDSAAEGIRNALIRGVALGWNPRKMEREARAASGRVLSSVLRIHRTSALWAFREAGHQARNENADLFNGWVWLSAANSRTCPSCWAMHGTHHRNSERLDDHPNGRCTAVVKVRGYSMPEIQAGADKFDKLPARQQVDILGPARYQAYRDGRITLNDMVHRRTSRAWGTTRRAATLAQALANSSR